MAEKQGFRVRLRPEADIQKQSIRRNFFGLSTNAPIDARGIIESIGLKRVWRYQKYRTSYRLGALHALLDETPIGNFLELEGPKVEIDRWAGALGFSTDEYLTETYRDLYETWCREHQADVGDMVFEGDGA